VDLHCNGELMMDFQQNLVCVESHFKSSCFKNRVKWSCYHLLYCTL